MAFTFLLFLRIPPGFTSLPPAPQSPHHSGSIFPRSSLRDLFCAYLVCHSASLSHPSALTSLCFCLRVGQAVAGRAEGRENLGKTMAGRESPPCCPQKIRGGRGARMPQCKYSSHAAVMQRRRKRKGTQGLCYALFLLILGLPSAAI